MGRLHNIENFCRKKACHCKKKSTRGGGGGGEEGGGEDEGGGRIYISAL